MCPWCFGVLPASFTLSTFEPASLVVVDLLCVSYHFVFMLQTFTKIQPSYRPLVRVIYQLINSPPPFTIYCGMEKSFGELSSEAHRSSPPPMYRTDCAAQPTFRGQSGDPTRPGLQHLNAAQLRLRTGDQLTETIDDYIDVFQELQIDPVYHNTFWHDVIYRYRQAPRHATFLKRGTAASIKNMSNDILRAYGLRIWGPKSGWRSGLAQGEKPLVYERAGDNSRLALLPCSAVSRN